MGGLILIRSRAHGGRRQGQAANTRRTRAASPPCQTTPPIRTARTRRQVAAPNSGGFTPPSTAGDADDLGAVHDAVDERADTRCGSEDLRPLGEGFVRRDLTRSRLAEPGWSRMPEPCGPAWVNRGCSRYPGLLHHTQPLRRGSSSGAPPAAMTPWKANATLGSTSAARQEPCATLRLARRESWPTFSRT